MPYEIKERRGKFYVVDTATNRIRGEYEDEDSAEDRLDELQFREEMRSGVSRIPGKELTEAEKAAEYDKIKAAEQEDKNLPPKKNDDADKDGDKTDKTDKKEKTGTRKSLYWGDLED